jgi:hypothetical protein
MLANGDQARTTPMNIARSLSRASVAGCAAIGVCVISMAEASAANVVFFPNADISTMPYVISLDGGASTFTFTDINDAADTFIVGVSTGGNAMVDSFVGFPSPFQQDSLISDADIFSAFANPTGILFSNSLVSIGLEFELSDGVHFGYATVFGPEVVQYGYNNTPGAPIATLAAAPEPATWVMMIVGLGALGALARSEKQQRRKVMA